jgi:RimJ/RimL family protein N-acetyltransferase
MIIHAETDEERETLLEYLTVRLGISKTALVGNMPYNAIGVYRLGCAVGAVLLTNNRGTSIEIAYAGEPGWLTRATVREVCRHAFDTIGVHRIWGTISCDNRASHVLASRLGCRMVGVLEDEFGPEQDGSMYAMTRKRCKWL